MSRKSRHPRHPELVRETSAADSLESADVSEHRITGELRTALDAIVSACALLTHGIGAAGPAEFPDHAADPDAVLGAELDAVLDTELDPELDAELDELSDALAPVALTMRVIARALIATALDRRPPRSGPYIVHAPSGVDADVEARALDMLAHTLLPESLPAAIRPSRAEREAALDDASQLLHEVGLEEFDISCHLGIDDDGTHVLIASPVVSESAHVSLIETLFDRAEAAAFSRDPLLAIERDASSWEFSRWSAAPPPGTGSPGAMDFPRHVREQEYSLADRITMALDASVIGKLTNDPDFAELFPRQHRVAEALLASFVGVFECVAVQESGATLRALSDEQTYEVHEHMAPPAYSKGWIAIGRLLPFDGDLHLRSPGMIFAPPNERERASAAANALAALSDTLPPALALEAVISGGLFGVAVPRAVKPARSRADARELLAAIEDVLADADLQREIFAEEVTEDFPPHSEGPESRYLELGLDATLAGFMAALADQAGLGPERQGEGGASRKKKKSKRKTKRRR